MLSTGLVSVEAGGVEAMDTPVVARYIYFYGPRLPAASNGSLQGR